MTSATLDLTILSGKRCCTCKEVKIAEEFSPHGRQVNSYCKRCAVGKTTKRRLQYASEGRCWRCGKPAVAGRQQCQECIQKGRAYSATRYKANKNRAVALLGGSCADCDLQTPITEVYDFHHLDPDQKEDDMGRLLHGQWDQRIEHELSKCVLLCANCHRIRHAGEKA